MKDEKVPELSAEIVLNNGSTLKISGEHACHYAFAAFNSLPPMDFTSYLDYPDEES